ncbi:MAG: 50S ribosomal protein L25/general stress protein Ctc [Bacteroidota bacterium]
MKSVSMSGSLRENVGKKDAKHLRVNNQVPCVLYGGKDQIHFAIEETQFKHLIYTPEVHLVELTVDGKKYTASLQDVQFHPTTDKLLHVDFLLVIEEKPLIIGVPIAIVGNSPGVIRGGKLFTKLRKLKVRALPKHLPDTIKVDISNLDIDETIKVNEITVDNVVFLDVPSAIVVGVRSTRAVEEPVPGAK